ncbi:HAD domain-containing protein [Ammoniphilus sp. CFH 90114]|uniref:HAD domain-containing protein n=1 Tax=Ammoniphilus sp. CFH 90114 TaxID=2493665 RepID=UPI00100E18E7|nr:HAD domain-containing protein [Ammoniphilus sp. CFH 90114]RXT06434.1 hypothetical protein EIZ39_15300 [Ammoniphilus sp. CFH 90114]
MKVIFLDIDGVMITGSYRKISSQYDGYAFDPTAVEHLKEIIVKTGTYIVVSSTWRKAGFARLKTMFEANGIYEGLIGQTPVLEYSRRGEEIKEYLAEAQYDPTTKVEKFVILDDLNDMGELLPYLVQTNWMVGLNQEAKEKVIEMLK